MMIDILYESDEILVVDKPAGLASQPGERVGSSVLSVVERELHFVPLPVHRLDKDTAGCMMLAKNPAAAAKWSELLASRAVRKVYWAVCDGGPGHDEGTYSDMLEMDGKRQKAITHYRCLSRFGVNGDGNLAFSLLELELGSGRTHQIRRHMAIHGHPILGDDKYGNFVLNRRLKKETGLKHLLLWARRLELPGEILVGASLPLHFSDFLKKWPDSPGPEDL